MLLHRKSLRTILSSLTPSLPTPPSRTFWIRLPFLGHPSTLLAKELERFNNKVGFYPSLQLALCSDSRIESQTAANLVSTNSYLGSALLNTLAKLDAALKNTSI